MNAIRKIPVIAPPADIRARLAAFNAANPIGTPGHLIRDGRAMNVNTRSRAQLRSDGAIVVWFTGINGCFSIDAFVPATRA